ncbi:hypothetical protein F2P45_31580 [Massilia sp. CCM 8733]|uniref:LITAF domain-containing protein n=1 Tax=Massilia mucilaginosa TaxID=2609282 RepID=A0ABX0P434_9BURK|nr:hypothetical protein [Massilia mucilaginosa]NHZ93510.1 hypothetical protein [Massilia mucilaginosa]
MGTLNQMCARSEDIYREKVFLYDAVVAQYQDKKPQEAKSSAKNSSSTGRKLSTNAQSQEREMNIDLLPVPELDCPQCGANKWRHFAIPGQTGLQQQLLRSDDRLMTASFAVFVAAIFLLIVPALRDLGFVAVGILLCLVPSSFLVLRWTDNIKSTLHLCETCGFVSSE